MISGSASDMGSSQIEQTSRSSEGVGEADMVAVLIVVGCSSVVVCDKRECLGRSESDSGVRGGGAGGKRSISGCSKVCSG
jgi:hypothetical protein